jgi:hypothetical protein
MMTNAKTMERQGSRDIIHQIFPLVPPPHPSQTVGSARPNHWVEESGKEFTVAPSIFLRAKLFRAILLRVIQA